MPIPLIDVIRQQVYERLDHLDKHLTYHCKAHTEDVERQSLAIAAREGVQNSNDLLCLQVAALYHDTGFLNTYVQHEEESCKIFLADTIDMHFTNAQIETICGLIMATKVPQQPHSHLEQIICDADLDYLGRDDFAKIGDTLRLEFIHYGVVSDDAGWEKLQLKFLQNHRYHTASSQSLREPVKQQHLSGL
jgi:predicted metal-dependent HD superfamily phosphohydrolase